MTAMRIAPAKMIHSIASAAVLGVLAALGILYAAGPSEWRNGIAAGRGTFGTAEAKNTIEARTTIEDWPICSSIGMLGSEADWAELDPDFAAGKKALAKSEWTKAITALEFATARDPGNADIQNYIGYGYRRLSQLGPAMGHFQQALLLNPRHRGAHEHLGELFLALNEPAQAEEQLAALKQICLIPCEEFGSLQQAIEVGKRFSTR
jgi:tetratricopeptide (TPR) repeat protein